MGNNRLLVINFICGVRFVTHSIIQYILGNWGE